jgi:hypothetical protein
VNNKKGEELFDLKNDPGETTNVINEYPEVVAQLRAIYDRWWTKVQPRLVNEDAYQPSEEDKQKNAKKDEEKRLKKEKEK